MQTWPVTGDRIYQSALCGIERFAVNLTDRIQSGSLSQYLSIIFSVFIFTVASVWIMHRVPLEFVELTAVPPLALVITVLMIVATAVVAVSRSRLLSVCALGIVGSGALEQANAEGHGRGFLVDVTPDVFVTGISKLAGHPYDRVIRN